MICLEYGTNDNEEERKYADDGHKLSHKLSSNEFGADDWHKAKWKCPYTDPTRVDMFDIKYVYGINEYYYYNSHSHGTYRNTSVVRMPSFFFT